MLQMGEAQLCLPRIFLSVFTCELSFGLAPKKFGHGGAHGPGPMQNQVSDLL